MTIVVDGLTKTYGKKVAVSDLSFEVPSGLVTGFLGPNGAGKSTTMRLMVGAHRPDSGRVTFDGQLYNQLDEPLRVAGCCLDASAINGHRSARSHLRAMAAAAGLPPTRVDAVLEQVGLADVAGKKVQSFSLGMRQRLGIAQALLGDPAYLLLDEPSNGLDPEGVLWIREALRNFADAGRGVLVSSHMLAELSLVVDRLVVIGRGRLIREASKEEFLAGAGGGYVFVRTPDAAELRRLLEARNATVQELPDGSLHVTGCAIELVGEVASNNNVVLHEVKLVEQSLEDAFLDATSGSQEYVSGSSVR